MVVAVIAVTAVFFVGMDSAASSQRLSTTGARYGVAARDWMFTSRT